MKPEMKNLVLAVIVRELRKKQNLSQELLAELAEVNVRTIQRLEKDGSYSADTLNAVADAFDLDAKELLATAGQFTRQAVEEAERETQERYLIVPLARVQQGNELAGVLSAVHFLQPDYRSGIDPTQEKQIAAFFDLLGDHLDVDSVLSHTERLEQHRALDAEIAGLESAGLRVFAGRATRHCKFEGGKPFTLEQAVVLVTTSDDPRIQRAANGAETVSAALERRGRLNL